MRKPRLPLALLTAGLAVAPAAWSARPVLAADEAPKAPADKPSSEKPAADKPADKPAERPAGERPARPASRLDPAALVDRVAAAADKLSLSAEQKAKVEEAVAKAKATLADAAKGGREGMLKAVGELRESLNATLTEEQRAKLAEAVPFLNRLGNLGGGGGGNADRPNRRPGADAGNPSAGAPGERMINMARAAAAAIDKLDVSAELKAKAKAINDEYDGKVRKLIEELKDNREALAEKLRPLLEERRQKLAELFSPEQLQKFQDLVREQAQQLRGGAADRPVPKPDAAKPEGETKKD